MPGRARHISNETARSADTAILVMESVMAMLPVSKEPFDIRCGELVSRPAPQTLTGEPSSSDGVTATFEARSQRAAIVDRTGFRIAVHLQVRVIT